MSYYTVIETSSFIKTADRLWSKNERDEFISWIANNPFEGDVVPETGGLRKVRWSRAGRGTRGGTRIIYYNTLSNGCIWLIVVYAKNEFDNLPKKLLCQLKELIDV